MSGEESFPIPLKFFDVTRSTHTDLDFAQEKRIDDYWNVQENRSLSDSWTGFTRFTFLNETFPKGYLWSGRRLTTIQTASCECCSLFPRALKNIVSSLHSRYDLTSSRRGFPSSHLLTMRTYIDLPRSTLDCLPEAAPLAGFSMRFSDSRLKVSVSSVHPQIWPIRFSLALEMCISVHGTRDRCGSTHSPNCDTYTQSPMLKDSVSVATVLRAPGLLVTHSHQLPTTTSNIHRAHHSIQGRLHSTCQGKGSNSPRRKCSSSLNWKNS